MMKTFKYWMLFCLSLCASVAFARKGYVEQNIHVTAFDELEISGLYMATLEPSDKYEIVLEVPEQLMTYARTRVVDKKVMLSFDMDRMSRSEQQYMSEHRPYVSIKAPSFHKLELCGATSMDLKGFFSLDEVKLTLCGASNFNADRFKTKKLTMDISGACNINVQDLVADDLKMDVSGASHCDHFSIDAKRMKMDVSGASHINVRDLVSDELKMDISGASHCNHSSIDAKKMKVDLSGNSYLEMKAFANYADVEVFGMSSCDWEPLNGKVGERLEVEVSGLSKMNAGKIRYRNICKEVNGMSKLKIGKERR